MVFCSLSSRDLGEDKTDCDFVWLDVLVKVHTPESCDLNVIESCIAVFTASINEELLGFIEDFTGLHSDQNVCRATDRPS